ncbi:MAG: TlpA disulfide reductase family protein [Gammaproteobacteria bacterium]|nr:TlpA disulfide reductase family protein [Gammaproteobacteria bacterium]
MKKTLASTALLGIAVSVAACSHAPSKTFQIVGHYITVDPSIEEATASEESSQEAITTLSTATVIVTDEVDKGNESVETIELATGAFVDGLVTIEGEIEQPTEVEIFVQVDENTRLSTDALLVPGGEEVTFALVDHKGEYPPDQLLLYGVSRRAKDPQKKFTVSGDVSGVELKDLSLAIARVDSSRYNKDGSLQHVPHGYVLIRDNKFVIEGEVDEVMTVSIGIEKDWDFRSSRTAIVEPMSEITVISHGAPRTLVATSTASKHIELVESWQQSAEFMSKRREYIAAWEAKERLEQQQAAQHSIDKPIDSQSEAEENPTSDDVAKASGETEDAETEANGSAEKEDTTVDEEMASAAPVADGCEHVPLDEVIPSPWDIAFSSNFSYPDWVLLRQELGKIRSRTLEHIAENSEDPISALLAMEMGAFRSIGPVTETDHLALAIYDRIATQLDEDLVARRVLPPRNALAQRIVVRQNNEILVPGQKAPGFSLPDLEGTNLALYDVLDKNELVFVDFWASWCGPCIATFPDLKKFYEDFNGDGFEIVVISIDDTFEEWEEASDEHDLPWPNIADIGGFRQETPTNYGVESIPKGFLIDSKGCILQKDLTTESLEKVLVAQFTEESVLSAE